MALNAHDDSLMSINGFRINLKLKDKKDTFRFHMQLKATFVNSFFSTAQRVQNWHHTVVL